MAKKNKRRQRKNLNSLIPMQTPEGDRVFVNAWDVPERVRDGWETVGDVRQHTSTTRAPVEALDPKNDPKDPAKASAKGGGKAATKGGGDDKQDPKDPAKAGA
jgi:hypothetical protein